MKTQRHHIIMKLISADGFVRVTALADYLQVTKETIRSDLTSFAKRFT